MELALLWVISAVIGGGVCGALIIIWDYSLRLSRVEKHILSSRLTGNAKSRWTEKDMLEQVRTLQPAESVPKRERYANDFD